MIHIVYVDSDDTVCAHPEWLGVRELKSRRMMQLVGDDVFDPPCKECYGLFWNYRRLTDVGMTIVIDPPHVEGPSGIGCMRGIILSAMIWLVVGVIVWARLRHG